LVRCSVVDANRDEATRVEEWIWRCSRFFLEEYLMKCLVTEVSLRDTLRVVVLVNEENSSYMCRILDEL